MMNEWLKTLLSLSVSGTLLLLILLGLKRFYKNRFSRRWQYYILLLVVLRFLLPVTPGATDAGVVGNLFHKFEKSWSPDGAVTGNHTTERGSSVCATETGSGIYMTEQDSGAFLFVNTDNSGETLPKSAGGSISPASLFPIGTKPFNISVCLFWIWVIMALLFFARKITVYRDFVRSIRAGNREITDRRILNLLSDCQEKLQTKARVELSCNPFVTSPVMIGFFCPNIILPVDEMEDGALSHIFLHELVHYKRKDMFYKWLIQIVICLHWFNPFVYLLEKEVNRACELSCDEKVLTLLDEEARRGYGDTLLSFCKPDGPNKNSLASISLTEGAEQIKERLGAIMKFKKTTKGVIAATVILSVGLFGCFWETGAYVAAHASGDRPAASQNSIPDAGGNVAGGNVTEGNIIGETGKPHVILGQSAGNYTQVSGAETDVSVADVPKATADIKGIKFNIVKTVSDERCLYLYFSMKANDGVRLAPDGRFADVEVLFPDKMMSGVYQPYFLERQDDVPENELEGVVYADWQADEEAKRLELRFRDWQEKVMYDDVKVAFNVSEVVAEAGENAGLSCLYEPNYDRYLWQPGNADISLPYDGVTICNAGWEDGILQMVMKCSKTAADCQMYQNWYFVDTRTNKVIRPETGAWFRTRDQFEPTAENPDDYYVWQFVSVDEEALSDLEMHWGGKEIFTPVFLGEWKVSMDETPVMEKSKLLAEDVKLYYAGKELHVDKIECSGLSLGIYFTGYVDPTTGILGEFAAFGTDGNPININWGFTADVDDKSCMIWTRFAEPIDPESIGLLTFDGETIFMK